MSAERLATLDRVRILSPGLQDRWGIVGPELPSGLLRVCVAAAPGAPDFWADFPADQLAFDGVSEPAILSPIPKPAAIEPEIDPDYDPDDDDPDETIDETHGEGFSAWQRKTEREFWSALHDAVDLTDDDASPEPERQTVRMLFTLLHERLRTIERETAFEKQQRIAVELDIGGLRRSHNGLCMESEGRLAALESGAAVPDRVVEQQTAAFERLIGAINQLGEAVERQTVAFAKFTPGHDD